MYDVLVKYLAISRYNNRLLLSSQHDPMLTFPGLLTQC
jgi:hypothetical protein